LKVLCAGGRGNKQENHRRGAEYTEEPQRLCERSAFSASPR
jgi:hypothetical protein